MATDFSKYGKPVAPAPAPKTAAGPATPIVQTTEAPKPVSNFGKYGTVASEPTTTPTEKPTLFGFIKKDLTQQAKPEDRPTGVKGFLADVFQSTLGSGGASGLAQAPVKPFLQAASANAQMDVQKSRQDVNKQVDAIVERLKTMPEGPEKDALAKQASDMIRTGQGMQATADEINASTPQSTSTMDDIKKIGGQALNTASLFVGGEGAAEAGGQVVKKTLGQAIKTGIKTGAEAGAMQGAGGALNEGGDIADVLGGAVKGAAVGGITGAAVPAVFGGIRKAVSGIQGSLAEKAATKAEEAALLRSGAPDARVADKALTATGEVVADKTAKEAIRQGVPEADVALVKTSSEADKAKMLKMLDTREQQLTNKRVTARATDVPGDTFVQQVAKPLQETNKKAAEQLNVVAKSLAGKKVDPSSAITQFGKDLESSGIGVKADGTLDFKNSDFEGIKGAQNAIKQVWARAMRVAKTGDALQLHRLKTYIDQVVDYGKQADGLTGKAERLIKMFRHNADEVLDSKFPAYNKVNTVYSDTIQELGKIADAMGTSFKIGENFADAKAGVTMRRILSNTQSRGNILQMLESAQAVAKKYGAKINEDIISQVSFADTLEKMLGSEAPTSFLGNLEKGVQGAEQAVGAMGEFGRGNLVRGTLKAGKFALDATRGISQENKIAALRALLTEGQKTGTVFGKKAATEAAIGAEKLSPAATGEVPTARYNKGMTKPAMTQTSAELEQSQKAVGRPQTSNLRKTSAQLEAEAKKAPKVPKKDSPAVGETVPSEQILYHGTSKQAAEAIRKAGGFTNDTAKSAIDLVGGKVSGDAPISLTLDRKTGELYSGARPEGGTGELLQFSTKGLNIADEETAKKFGKNIEKLRKAGYDGYHTSSPHDEAVETVVFNKEKLKLLK